MIQHARRLLILGLTLVGLAAAGPPTWQLPTENRHLLTGEPEKFYMYVDRTFEGVSSKPWEGGSWGLVRNPIRVAGQVQYLRFHEGIDIAPVKRDAAGNPVDLILSIAAGRVVHTSPVAGRSNYGCYLVVEHPVDAAGHVVHSLYAHLAEITVSPGDQVRAGSVLGRMGYTGRGINRTRAHLHLELGLLMSRDFQGWFDRHFGSTNHHGIYNGMNLIGMDVARFLTAVHRDPDLSVTDFVRDSPAYFKVTVPRRGRLDFAERHPWLAYGDLSKPSPSWEIAFTATGLPTGIAASDRKVSQPIVSAVRQSDTAHRYLTRGLLSGTGTAAELSRNGRRLVSLITGDFGGS